MREREGGRDREGERERQRWGRKKEESTHTLLSMYV